eukprot:jgi/Hompol1/4703/HPOL_003825-RA
MADRENLVSGAAPFGRIDGDIESAQTQATSRPEPTLLQQSRWQPCRYYSLEPHGNCTDGYLYQLTLHSHPTALVFHLLFRTAAIVVYLLSGFFTSNFIMMFVVIILLLAFDFWTVKNVTGRLLVGLRWWNEIRDDGTNQWVFESRENRVLNNVDSRIFWMGLYISPAIWTLFAVAAFLKFQPGWLTITIVAISMNVANLIGYIQCEKDAKKKIANYIADQGILSSVVSGLVSNRISSFFGGNGNTSAAGGR